MAIVKQEYVEIDEKGVARVAGHDVASEQAEVRSSIGLVFQEVTLDDYLNARMIADPLCLYDCDLPCDGSTALVVSSVETSDDSRHVPVQVGGSLGSIGLLACVSL